MASSISFKKVFFYAVTALIFVAIRWFFNDANVSQLLFLLKPISGIVGLFAIEPAVFSSETGYFFPSLQIVIDSSCAGIHFLSLLFLFISCSAIYFQQKKTHYFFEVFGALAASYVLSIFISVIRIAVSIAAQQFANLFLPPRPHLVLHEWVGILVHLFFLIILFKFIKNRFKNTPPDAEIA